jgi:eukaryotic-like serine/threonine-protein kinase
VNADRPARLGKYEIVQELGAGAMGVVYLGYDAAIDRKVAVKTIRKDRLDAATASEAAARFRQEAMAAGRLTHPGIVAVYDYGEDENVAYIVMEYAPGEELGRYAEGKTLALPEIGALMEQLFDALAYAHQAGVVHRDIKPSNILLSGRLKITDFGIARIASSQLTQTGIAMGTPAYMAPEQYRGVGVDHRVDLFASSVLFYELLTGRPPFPGETIEEIAYKVCHVEPVPATRLRPDVPRGVDAVVARALAKDKEARFPSASELSRAIGAALAGRDVPVPGVLGVLESAPTVAVSSALTTGALASRAGSSVTPAAIERITQTLARYVGPIAKVMVKKAGAEAKTYRELGLAIASRLAPEERARFLGELGLE